jgi:hypothetical protein
MKKVKSLIAIVFLAFGMFVINACSDPCKDVTCQNGGVCDEGTCNCAPGFEGEECATAMNAKFIGSYNVARTCGSGFSGNYTNQVTAGSAANIITFSNLGNFNTPALLSVGVNGTEVSSTDVTDTYGRKFTVNGSMNSTNTTMSLTYTVVFTDATTDNCTCTFVKY